MNGVPFIPRVGEGKDTSMIRIGAEGGGMVDVSKGIFMFGYDVEVKENERG